MEQDLAAVAAVAVLDEEDALPGAKHQLAVENGDATGSPVSMVRIWAGMSSGPSAVMHVAGVPGREAVEGREKIGRTSGSAFSWIGQGGGGMPAKDGQKPVKEPLAARPSGRRRR